MVKQVAVMVSAVLVFCAGQVFAAEGLTEMVNAGKPIKVFVKDIVPAAGETDVDTANCKANLEQAFKERKSVRFELVTDPAASDVQIAATEVSFQYLEKGPMKMSASPTTLALDAMATMQYNYVEAAGTFTVTATKTGAILWRDTASTYLKKSMTPQSSVELAFDKLARHVVAKAFGKPTR